MTRATKPEPLSAAELADVRLIARSLRDDNEAEPDAVLLERLLAEHAALTARAEAAERKLARQTARANELPGLTATLDEYVCFAAFMRGEVEGRSSNDPVVVALDELPDVATALAKLKAIGALPASDAEQPAPQPSADACPQCDSAAPHGREECASEREQRLRASGFEPVDERAYTVGDAIGLRREPVAVEADPSMPLDVALLPDAWDARRRAQGRPDLSRCAAELRRALAASGGTDEANADAPPDAIVDLFAALKDALTKGPKP